MADLGALGSIAWGGKQYPVSQPFGVYNPELAGWYGYAADYGYPAGTHIGIDVAVPKFTPIYAAQSGTVTEAGWSDSFRPNPVRIKESDGDEAIYGHLWSAAVAGGQKVKRGQLIGYSGEQTVRGTMQPDGSGPHIHFELRRPDPVTGGMKAVNPIPELTGGADYSNPADDYAKNPYDTLGYNFGIDKDALESGGKRVLLGVSGIIAAVLGAYLLFSGAVPGVVKGIVG